MTYIATLTFDHAGADPNEQARLTNALVQAGWEYAGRSALVMDGDDLSAVRLGLEVLARAIEAPGALTALALQVQLVGDRRQPPAATNHKRALPKILGGKSLPDRPWGSADNQDFDFDFSLDE